MKFVWLGLMLAGLAAGQSTFPETMSGPFYRHTVTTIFQGQGCVMTINGQGFGQTGRIIIEGNAALNATIAYRIDCNLARGLATSQTTGSLTLSGFKTDFPVATRTNISAFTLPPGSMPTSVAGSATYTPGLSRTPNSLYDATLIVRHGNASSSGGTFTNCNTSTQERLMAPKGTLALNAGTNCANNLVYRGSVSPSHGFGEPFNSEVANIYTEVEFTTSERWQGTNTSITDGGRASFRVESQYKMAPPKMSVSPSPLRVTAPIGSASARTAALDITNIAGGNLDWNIAVTGGDQVNTIFVVPGVAAGVVRARISPAQADGIGPGQSSRATLTFDTSGAVLRGTFTGSFPIRSSRAGVSSITIPVEVVVGDAGDDISISNVVPSGGSTLAAGSEQTFRATARVNLRAAQSGSVTLELFDQANRMLVSSAASTVNLGTADVNLVIPAYRLPSAVTQLTMKAVLRAGPATTESEPIRYTAGSVGGCAAPPTAALAAARTAPRTAEDECVLRISAALPFPSDPILATALGTPPFCAFGEYSYPGTRPAEITLVLSYGGAVLARSQPLRINPGVGGANWRSNCTSSGALVFIPEQRMPTIPIPAGAKYDQTIATLRLEAVLRDSGSGVEIATSNAVDYAVVPGVSFTPKLWGANSSIAGGGEDEYKSQPLASGMRFEDTLAAELLGGFYDSGGTTSATLRGILEFAGDSATVRAKFLAVDSAGTELPNDLRMNPERVVRGRTEFKGRSLYILGRLPVGAALTTIAPYLELSNGQFLEFDQIQVPSNSLRIRSITPDPGACSIQQAASCLTKATSNTIKAELTATALPAGARIMRIVLIDRDEVSTLLPTVLVPGETASVTDEFQVTLPANPASLLVAYQIVPSGGACSEFCAADGKRYSSFISQIFQLGAAAGNAIYDFSGGSLDGFNTAVNKQVRNIKGSVGLVNRFPNAKKDFDNWLKTAAENPSFLAIPSTWSFEPPIPRDGSFSARLTLRYTAEDLPKDPNFVESRMQIVSVDANGTLRAYPTTLNMGTKTATAQIDSLDPDYSLAVMGPFAQSGVFLTNPQTGFVQVNTAATDANLSVTPFEATGTGTAAASVLRGGNATRTLAADAPGWVQSWSTVPAVEGAAWADQGAHFAVTPASAPGVRFLFPGVEYAARKSTEFHVANVSWAESRVAINLRNADGTERGVYNATIPPKGSFSGRIESLFPGLPKGFSGYAVIAATQNIVASGTFSTSTSATGLVGIPMTDANLNAARKFGVRPGEASGAATLRLVNLGAATASITLRGRRADGTAAGNSVTIQLAALRQYDRAAAEIFAVESAVVASIQVDSNIPGVLGEILTVDSGFASAFNVSLPLVSAGLGASVLPYATADTTVYVYNPNDSAATVRVTSMAENGTAGPAATESVPGFGRVAIGSGTAGYLNISASQPVLTAGWLTNAAKTVTGYLALPSATALPVGQPGAKPTLSAAGVLNAASFQGGAVAPGEIVTIFGNNIGPGALTTLALDASGRVASYLGATRVYFDGIAAPLIYSLSGQTSVIVPYGVAGRATTQLVVEYAGRRSDPVMLNVVSAAPGLFSANSSGTGQGAILNQNSTVNSLANPAAKGSVAVFYGTGDGTGNPDVADGSVLAAVFPKPRLPVSVMIGGIAAEVLYAGAAPGLVAGVLQVNARVPANAPSGNVPVVVTVGGASSQSGLTLAIEGPVSAAPLITVTPAALDFGSVTSGQTRDLSVTIRNTGTANLSVTSITSSNARFTLTTGAAFSVAPGGTQTTTVRFAPNAVGAQTGTLTILSNDGAQPSVRVSLSGAGAAVPTSPAIEATPSALDFGSVTAAQTKDLTLTVRNTGSAGLTVSSITSSNARFAVIAPVAPFTVAAGSTQAVTVRFSPVAAGAQSGTLTVASNDPARPSVSVGVNGTGTAATGTLAIAVGQTLAGTLAASSGRSIDCPACFADRYQFTIATTQNLEIRLNSAAFDAFLQLLSPAGVVIDNDDDSGGGLNARLAGQFQAGTYVIEVTTAFEGEIGPYTISLAALP